MTETVSYYPTEKVIQLYSRMNYVIKDGRFVSCKAQDGYLSITSILLNWFDDEITIEDEDSSDIYIGMYPMGVKFFVDGDTLVVSIVADLDGRRATKILVVDLNRGTGEPFKYKQYVIYDTIYKVVAIDGDILYTMHDKLGDTPRYPQFIHTIQPPPSADPIYYVMTNPTQGDQQFILVQSTPTRYTNPEQRVPQPDPVPQRVPQPDPVPQRVPQRVPQFTHTQYTHPWQLMLQPDYMLEPDYVPQPDYMLEPDYVPQTDYMLQPYYVPQRVEGFGSLGGRGRVVTTWNLQTGQPESQHEIRDVSMSDPTPKIYDGSMVAIDKRVENDSIVVSLVNILNNQVILRIEGYPRDILIGKHGVFYTSSLEQYYSTFSGEQYRVNIERDGKWDPTDNLWVRGESIDGRSVWVADTARGWKIVNCVRRENRRQKNARFVV